MFNKSNFNNTQFIFFYIFCNGLAITAIEMTASRYLAPFFGTSTIVWANIIGVILIALAFGYSIGGKISQLFNDFKVFYLLGLLGGVLAFALPIVLGLIFNQFPTFANNVPYWESLGSFVISLLIFGIPVGFLAMLSPFAVRLISNEVNTVGNKAGNLYAISTIGSVIGIYLSTFFTVPYWGVKNTFFAMAIMMIILSIIGLVANDDKKFIAKHQGNVVAFFVLLACLSLLNATTLSSANKELLIDKDGLYQKVKVIKDGKNNYLFFNEGGGIQSAYDSNSPFIEYGDNDANRVSWYTNHYFFLPALKQFENKSAIDVLVVGYSGGAVGRILKHAEPVVNKTINIDGIEIDPLVNKVSTDFMGVKESDRKIFLEDGRTYLSKNNGSKKYDLIILDAYANSLSIAPHLLSSEFFGIVNANLTPEGLMIFNLNAKDNNSALFNKTLNSASQSFRNLIYSKTNTMNHFIIGGNDSLISPIEVNNPDISIQKYFKLYQISQKVFEPNPTKGVFTDDLNDSELLTQLERGKWF
jgi:predicted membrane-bound spermidine synthase